MHGYFFWPEWLANICDRLLKEEIDDSQVFLRGNRADSQSMFAEAGFSESSLKQTAGDHFAQYSKVVFSCQH